MSGNDNTSPAGLEKYSEGIQADIRSEAQIWRYGDIASALSSFEQTVEWARRLNQEQRKYHHAGYWYANQLMYMTAVAFVQEELRDDPGCDSYLCRPGAHCHPKPTPPGLSSQQ
ncbi:hypothetical protein ACF07Y_42810 [Streptomyces sp. NPDC016566]|uniref:hypothetical protein n=1 Tax=Streptomyces sp. NPDC016566 TaxID=3364967 RepID=UPI0037024694